MGRRWRTVAVAEGGHSEALRTDGGAARKKLAHAVSPALPPRPSHPASPRRSRGRLPGSRAAVGRRRNKLHEIVGKCTRAASD